MVIKISSIKRKIVIVLGKQLTVNEHFYADPFTAILQFPSHTKIDFAAPYPCYL